MKNREKWVVTHPFLVEQSQDREISLSSDAGKEDPDFGLPETSKKRKQIQKSNLQLISTLIPLSGVKTPVWWETNMVLAIKG